MSSRIAYFDILRGIAIVGVVANHSSYDGIQSPDNSVNLHFTMIWRQLINFSVPLFLAVSGYLSAKKTITSSEEYFSFLKRQVPRVYIPFFIWSSVWFILIVLFQEVSISHQFYKLITFQSSGPYYFIALIIQYYLLIPVLKRLANVKGLIISAIISIAMTWLFFYLQYYTEIHLPLIVKGGNFLTWILFFVLGLYLGSSVSINIPNKVLGCLVVVLYLLSCAESYIIYAIFHQAGPAMTAVKTLSFLYSAALIVFLFKNQDLIRSTVLKHVGEVSFGIYLIHMFVFLFMKRIIMRFSPSMLDIQPLYQFVLIGTILLLSYAFIVISNRFISPGKSRILGFK